MSKASLYECCVTVNECQKKQKLKQTYNSILSTLYDPEERKKIDWAIVDINQIWPPFMTNVARMPKSRAVAIMNARYGLSSSFAEYKKRIEDEFGIDQ